MVNQQGPIGQQKSTTLGGKMQNEEIELLTKLTHSLIYERAVNIISLLKCWRGVISLLQQVGAKGNN